MEYFLDFEGTQFSHRIISIGAVCENGHSFYSLVKPESKYKISKMITELTGITIEDIDNAKGAIEVFNEFYNWSICNGYKENLTIDRIDNNGTYEPSHCRWVTTKEQNRNYSKNRFYYIDNKKYCIAEISEKYNINYRTLLYRLNNNYTLEEAIKGVK